MQPYRRRRADAEDDDLGQSDIADVAAGSEHDRRDQQGGDYAEVFEDRCGGGEGESPVGVHHGGPDRRRGVQQHLRHKHHQEHPADPPFPGRDVAVADADGEDMEDDRTGDDRHAGQDHEGEHGDAEEAAGETLGRPGVPGIGVPDEARDEQ